MNFTSQSARKAAGTAARGLGHCLTECVGWTLFLLLSLAFLPNSSAVAADSQANGQLQVSAVVRTMIKVKVVSQPSHIEIAPRHISQGYIDIEDASVLLITSNSRDGFMMSLTHNSQLVSRVSATVYKGSGTADGDNMVSVRTQQVNDEPVRVSYRLHLHPQARTGNVPWPVALSFTPRAV